VCLTHQGHRTAESPDQGASFSPPRLLNRHDEERGSVERGLGRAPS
jgi:hypothetical protein